MGIALSKKHGKAVLRNKIKRLIRESFYKTNAILNGAYWLIVLPKIMDKYSFADFEKSFNICFKKLNSCEK